VHCQKKRGKKEVGSSNSSGDESVAVADENHENRSYTLPNHGKSLAVI